MEHQKTSPIKVWPVIHLEQPSEPYENVRVAYENAAIAARCGCEGVFVIQMEGQDDDIDPVALEIRRRHPELKVGVNYLSLPAGAALQRSLALGMDATWTDRPGVRSDAITEEAKAIRQSLLDAPGHQFFGSVAFKYQRIDPDPTRAALNAISMGMIPTTSGEATGMAPPAEKLATMRRGLTGYPLALASGASPVNIGDLGPHLSHVLVSTGVSKSFYEFDEEKLRDLVERAQGL